MTFQQSTGFKSVFGGVFSILVIFSMAAISINGFQRLYNKEIKSTMVSKTFVNIFDNKEEHKFMENGPEFIFNYKALVPPSPNYTYIPPWLFDINLKRIDSTIKLNGDSDEKVTDVPHEV
jgi:hypothetical protein